jgi:hypothetical protein
MDHLNMGYTNTTSLPRVQEPLKPVPPRLAVQVAPEKRELSLSMAPGIPADFGL